MRGVVDLAHEQFERAAPDAEGRVERLVDHEVLLGLAVLGEGEDAVEVALAAVGHGRALEVADDVAGVQIGMQVRLRFGVRVGPRAVRGVRNRGGFHGGRPFGLGACAPRGMRGLRAARFVSHDARGGFPLQTAL